MASANDASQPGIADRESAAGPSSTAPVLAGEALILPVGTAIAGPTAGSDPDGQVSLSDHEADPRAAVPTPPSVHAGGSGTPAGDRSRSPGPGGPAEGANRPPVSAASAGAASVSDVQPRAPFPAPVAGRTGLPEAISPSLMPARLAQVAAALPQRGAIVVRLRLDPPSLGEVRVSIGSTHRGIEVRIVAQSHAACALLAEGRSQLGRELGRYGLSLHSFAASMGQPDPDHASPRQGPDSPSHPPRSLSRIRNLNLTPDPSTTSSARRLDRRV